MIPIEMRRRINQPVPCRKAVAGMGKKDGTGGMIFKKREILGKLPGGGGKGQ